MRSLAVTIFCLFGSLILVFIGTLLQTQMDIHEVQNTIFRPFFIWWKGIPIFPGGGFFATVLILNLATSFWKRKYWKKRSLMMIHAGFFLLILGEVLRMVSAQESLMILPKNTPINYSESPTERELAVIDHSFHENELIACVILDGKEKKVAISKGTHTIRISDESYEFKPYGVWPLVNGTRHLGLYEIAIRPKRIYYPFSVKLDTFSQEMHPGTNIPKFFSSEVTLLNQQGALDRSVKIWMNHPLHYQGKTFYQVSFEESGDVSVLQVVENRWKVLPYLSLGIIGLGLIFHFANVVRKRR